MIEVNNRSRPTTDTDSRVHDLGNFGSNNFMSDSTNDTETPKMFSYVTRYHSFLSLVMTSTENYELINFHHSFLLLDNNLNLLD